MITKSKKVLSCLLACMLLLSAVCVNASALYADSAWETYYNEFIEDGSAVLMSPGSDETERNFSWFSPALSEEGKILVSETPDFAEYKTFTGTRITTPEIDRRNKVTVSGLELGKQYFYRIFNGDNLVKESSFKTLAGNDFTAVYMTDIHVTRREDDMENSLLHQSYTLNEVLKKANEKAPFDLILSSGDQATKGDRREYTALVASPFFESVPMALCVGNHDRKGIAYKVFNNHPNQFTDGTSSLIGNDYWYVKGDVLFLVYDSNNQAAISHRNFTRQAIEANPDVKWKVAFMHHDLYGRLTDSREEETKDHLRPVFVPIFDEFGIDIVFLGHSHYYSVSNALYDDEIVGTFDEDNKITDAKGTIYMVSNSINHPRSGTDVEPQPQNAIAIQKDGPVYNIVNFSEDEITVKSYALDEDTPFNTFTVAKTTPQGGHIEQDGSAPNTIMQILREFVAFFVEIAEGISGIWKNFFDK